MTFVFLIFLLNLFIILILLLARIKVENFYSKKAVIFIIKNKNELAIRQMTNYFISLGKQNATMTDINNYIDKNLSEVKKNV